MIVVESPAEQRPAWLPPDFGSPLLVVVSGPTAVGKTTLLRRMEEIGLPYHIGVTATTRPRREGEVDGRDYYFLTDAEFQAILDLDEFLEHAVVHQTARYGILREPLRRALADGKDVLLPPEVQGAATVRAKAPGVVTIFLAPPTFDDLERRIRARGRERSEEEIARRLATARAELARVDEFDYLVMNEDGRLDRTVHEIDAIIQAEKRRLHRRPVVI